MKRRGPERTASFLFLSLGLRQLAAAITRPVYHAGAAGAAAGMTCFAAIVTWGETGH
jgi:hypothetical protein